MTREIESIYEDKEHTQAIFPVTRTKVVSDNNGIENRPPGRLFFLDKIKQFILAKIQNN